MLQDELKHGARCVDLEVEGYRLGEPGVYGHCRQALPLLDSPDCGDPHQPKVSANRFCTDLLRSQMNRSVDPLRP